MKKNKSAGRFSVCEDFWRLNHLKCGAPELIQAKREPNPSEQIGNMPKAFFQNLQKNSKLKLNSRKFYSARISDVARIVRARGARCGRKTKFLWSNAGESRNPEKPGFGW